MVTRPCFLENMPDMVQYVDKRMIDVVNYETVSVHFHSFWAE